MVVFDHTIRSGAENKGDEASVRDPVKAVHNDYTENSGSKRVRDLLPADEAREWLRGRFAIVQIWRPICAVVESDPLAICDARSLPPEGFITIERHYHERVGETCHITYNAAHRWYYFPRMKRTEALVFKVYDSDKNADVRFTAHTAFDDPATLPGAPARESIETRTLVLL